MTFVASDLSTPDGADGLVAAAAEHGGVDVLVNNAGAVTVHPEGFASLTDDDWQASWDLNVMGVVRTTRAALPAMYKRGGGSIVIVGSVNAYFPRSGHIRLLRHQGRRHEHREGIVKANWGRRTFASTRSARDRCRPGCGSDDGGVADSIAGASGQTPAEVRASTAGAAATGRFTTPEQVADLVVFLASDRSGNITGSDLRIDGGLVTTL